jgi:hypothetical protein
VWGLDFGLPQVFHPDEPVVVTRAQYGAATNDWNPRAFQWPSLQIYILGLEFKIWYWVGGLRGAWDSEKNADVPPSDRFLAFALRAPSGFYYLARVTTVLFGAGLVWLIFLLASRYLGVHAALAASALIAIHPILARQGRYATPDIPSTFFFLAALILIDRLYTALLASGARAEGEEKPRDDAVRLSVWAAVMIGLGAGTKYPVGVLLAPLLIVILLAPSRFRALARILLALRAVANTLVTFILTTPYAVLDWRQFVDDVTTIGQHVRTGHIGMEATGGIWLASLSRMVLDCGWIWTIAGAIGLIVLLASFRRTWPLMLSLLFVLAGLAPLVVFSDRYLVPVIPFWAIGIACLIKILSDRCRGGKAWLCALVLVLVIGGQGLWVLCNDAYRLTLPDTREFALRWVEENIPAHSVIVEEQGGPDIRTQELVPLVPEPWYIVDWVTPLFYLGGKYEPPLDKLLTMRPEWVITSSQVRWRYMRPGAEEEFPGVVAAFRIYYRLIDEHLIEEARFSPGGGIVGPEVVVYRVPDGFWRRVGWENITVQEALEEEEEGGD